jgi:hypothetical protein
MEKESQVTVEGIGPDSPVFIYNAEPQPGNFNVWIKTTVGQFKILGNEFTVVISRDHTNGTFFVERMSLAGYGQLPEPTGRPERYSDIQSALASGVNRARIWMKYNLS